MTKQKIKELENRWFELIKNEKYDEAKKLVDKINKIKYNLSNDKNKYILYIKRVSIFNNTYIYKYTLVPTNYGYMFKIDKYDENFNLIKKGKFNKNKRLLYKNIKEAKKDLTSNNDYFESKLIKFEILKK